MLQMLYLVNVCACVGGEDSGVHYNMCMYIHGGVRQASDL